MNHIKVFLTLVVMLVYFSFTASGQKNVNVNFTSIICDKNGDPIPYASVYGDEGMIMKYSNANGKVTIKVPQDSKLVITAKGYKSKQVFAYSDLAKIVMEKGEDDQTVNVAYKKIDKRDLAGAISYINSKDIQGTNYNHFTTDGIDGKISGLLWANNIWGMANALVLVDGIPRNFDDVVFDEVDQVTVLKGAGAVALYGSQGAKGVVLITTKRGEVNKRAINVRVSQGLASPKMYPKYLGSADYMTLNNEAYLNDNPNATSTDLPYQKIESYRSGNKYIYPDVDYYSSDYLRKVTTSKQVTTEFSGGNEKAQFYTNLGWTGGNSLLNIGQGKNESNNRFNIRGNIDLKVNELISSTVDVSAVFVNNRNANADYWGNASSILPFRYSPLVPIASIASDSLRNMALTSGKVIAGNYLLGGTQEVMTNPFAALYAGGYNNYINRIFQFTNGIDVNLKNVLKGLSFHTKFNMDYTTSYSETLSPSYAVYQPAWSAPDSITSQVSIVGLTKYGTDLNTGTKFIANSFQKRNIGVSAQFNYETSINKAHNLSVILLGSAYNSSQNGVIQPSTFSTLGSQLSYNYLHKYLLDATGVVVSSSKLAPGHNTAFSPTVSLGWLLSSEKLLANRKWLDVLKLTASAGIVNTDLDISSYYLYESTYAQDGWFSSGDGTMSNRSVTTRVGVNKDLTFVKRKDLNVGLEALLFNQSLYLQATAFKNQMDGLLTQRTTLYPAYFNNFMPWENYNVNEYRGVEGQVNIHKKVGAFDLNLGATFTYATSEVIKRDELYEDQYRYRKGKTDDALWGLQCLGFFNDKADIANSATQKYGDVQPGDLKYKDQNNDGVIDDKDEVVIGRWNAPYVFAVNLNASYKNFSLYVQGTGNVGGMAVKSSNYYWVDGTDKYSKVVLGRWTEATKDKATYPRLSYGSNNNNFRTSDFWTYSTDRFNLNKVQISYNLPKNLLASTFVRDLSVYVNGSSLLTISKNKDILEMSTGAPYMRYYNIGVSAKF
jgi:TonB-linked outer membrane protein, SusC/RagA family